MTGRCCALAAADLDSGGGRDEFGDDGVGPAEPGPVRWDDAHGPVVDVGEGRGAGHAGDGEEDEDLDDNGPLGLESARLSRVIAAPALLGCLAGDAEAGADVGPGVAAAARSPVTASRMAASRSSARRAMS